MAAQSGSMPEVGKRAPAFTLPGHRGGKVQLTKLKGRPVVLYFYPKDDTPGCTVEAEAFRDAMTELEAAGAVVLGVGPDGVASHRKFAEKYRLDFELLADEQHKVAEKYGVWVEKNLYGRKYMGVQRATFLIGPTGKVACVWPKVKPKGHAQEVLEALGAL